MCFHLLETQQGMEVSKNQGGKLGKSIGIASSLRFCAKVRRTIGKLGVNVARGTRNLGMDFRLGNAARGGGGAAGGREAYRDRWRAANKLKERVLRLGTPGASQVTRAGLILSLQYGSMVTGVTGGALNSWRSLAAAAYGNATGRSAIARLILEKADPGTQVVAGGVEA